MRTYELALICDPDLGTEGQKKVLAKVKKEIEALKGKVGQETGGEKKELAYPIAKKTSGGYFWLAVNLPEAAVKDLEPKLRMQEGVLRYLLIKKGNGAKVVK